MKLVFASDSFKGTLSSARIGELLEQAARKEFPSAECAVFRIADGGEGTIDAIRAACEGDRVIFSAHDGLMRPVEGEIFIQNGKAFVEAASTCGLTLLDDTERNPLATTSYGVGECIRQALDQGCREVIVGLGGSCTNDGGMGCLRALGVRFFDAEGRELLGCGSDLAHVAQMDECGLHPKVKSASFTIMSDVENPLLGPNGATWVFGRQKGADDAALERLEQGMGRFTEIVGAAHPDVNFDTPGFGAAGGLGMALAVFLGARMRSGIEELLSVVGFDEAVRDADLVVTGEGKLDRQSLQGKAVSGVVSHARRAGVPVAAICGSVALEDRDLHELGLFRAIDISKGQPLDYALTHAEENYLKAAKGLFASLSTESLRAEVLRMSRPTGESKHSAADPGCLPVDQSRMSVEPNRPLGESKHSAAEPSCQSMEQSRMSVEPICMSVEQSCTSTEPSRLSGEPMSLESSSLGIRKATEGDLSRIMEIYATARVFMASHGNPNQWGPTKWPPEALVRQDIAQGKSFVCECGGHIVGVFFFDSGKDIEPTYAHIQDGEWLNDGPYGVVHRVASDGTVKGVGSTCINWAFSQCGHLRIDTHGDNVVMQRLLKKLGFTHCGTIFVEEDDYPRLAFEKVAAE